MYTHLAATRVYTYRMLWLDMILPEPDRDSGSVRTLSTLPLPLPLPLPSTCESTTPVRPESKTHSSGRFERKATPG